MCRSFCIFDESVAVMTQLLVQVPPTMKSSPDDSIEIDRVINNFFLEVLKALGYKVPLEHERFEVAIEFYALSRNEVVPTDDYLQRLEIRGLVVATAQVSRTPSNFCRVSFSYDLESSDLEFVLMPGFEPSTSLVSLPADSP